MWAMIWNPDKSGVYLIKFKEVWYDQAIISIRGEQAGKSYGCYVTSHRGAYQYPGCRVF